jgi:hypothetical protein
VPADAEACDDLNKYDLLGCIPATEAAKVFNSSSTIDAYPINISHFAAI